jgi:hypothetical protein
MKISISKNGEFVCMLTNVESTKPFEVEGINFLDVKLYNVNEPVSFCNCQFEVECEMPWDSQIFTNKLKYEMVDALYTLIDFDSPEFIQSLHA